MNDVYTDYDVMVGMITHGAFDISSDTLSSGRVVTRLIIVER